MWIEFKKYYLFCWPLVAILQPSQAASDVDIVIPVPCNRTNNFKTYSCNCNFGGHVMELQLNQGSIKELEIANCNTLIIRSRAFSNILDLKSIRIVNVNELELGEYAFDLPKNTETSIRFDRVHIKSIPSYAFMGSIKVVLFHNVTIEEFKPYSVSLLSDKIQMFKITNSMIGFVHPQAFKKFITDEFIVDETVFQDDLQSRAFYRIEVANLLSVTKSNFSVMLPGSFCFENVQVFRFNYNSVYKLDEEAINITSRSVEMTKNNFTFLHPRGLVNISPVKVLTVWERNQQCKLIFGDNVIENIDARWDLQISDDFASKFARLEVTTPKTCALIHDSGSNTFLRDNSHEIYVRSSSSPQHQLTLSEFGAGECKETSYIVYAYVGLAFLIICVILIIIFVLIYFHRQKKKLIQARMVSPEPRTYRETQIIVQVENHNLLKTDF